MQRATRRSALAMTAGLVVQAVGIGVVLNTSRPSDFGWFAYAPLSVADYRTGPYLLDAANPGPVALALGVALTIAAAVSVKRALLGGLAAAAIAAALAASPALSTPIGSAGCRLALVLGPGLLALALRRWGTGVWPWSGDPPPPRDQPG